MIALPQGNSPPYILDRRLGRPQRKSWRCEVQNISCSSHESNPGCPARKPSLNRPSYPDSTSWWCIIQAVCPSAVQTWSLNTVFLIKQFWTVQQGRVTRAPHPSWAAILIAACERSGWCTCRSARWRRCVSHATSSSSGGPSRYSRLHIARSLRNR
jgi:hypothetical protein